jgi:hypothetical protein
MYRLLLAALVLAVAAALLSMAVRALAESLGSARARAGLAELGDTPMQRLSFLLLVALIFYAAIWGAG